MNDILQRLSETAPSQFKLWLTKVATTMQHAQTERLWYVLIAIIVFSFVWVLGREVIRHLAGSNGRAMAFEKMGVASLFPSEVALGNHRHGTPGS